jgi:predicted CXXCH cytochrome family protein
VLFSRYPYTWEGGHRKGPAPGGSVTTSGEARDFLLGGPGRSLACTACHNPHALDEPAALARLATPAGNSVCAKCHPALATPTGLAEHAHHSPAGPGGACVACHMPRKNMGLAYALTRYHRIGSPTDRERVEGDRPLECALCHADRSVRFLVEAMEGFWDKKYDRRRLRALYGDLDGNALLATLVRGRPHEQVVAAMVLAENKVGAAAPAVAGLLGSRYPLARRFAAQALTMLRGQPCAIDVDGSNADMRRALVACGLAGAQPGSSGEPEGHPLEGGDED